MTDWAQDGALEERTIRRISWRLVPLLMVCYFAAYLDRVNISFAALQMNQDLHLSSAAYGLGAGLFFITYFLFGVPSNLLLYKVGAPRWIALIMLGWGVCAAGMAFVHTKPAFYAMRLLLGATEAGFYPGVLFYLTLWFPARHRGRILGLFIAAIPISGILGSPLSGLLLSLDGVAGVRGWRWLFMVEALPAIVMAPLILALLPAGPAATRWLPADERDWLVGNLTAEQRRVEIKSHSLLQALFTPLVLVLAATYFTNVCLLNGITFFLPQIISEQGHSAAETGFIAAVPSLFALVALLWWGRRSDARQERYGHAAVANFLGGALLLAAMLIPVPFVRLAALSLAFACHTRILSVESGGCRRHCLDQLHGCHRRISDAVDRGLFSGSHRQFSHRLGCHRLPDAPRDDGILHSGPRPWGRLRAGYPRRDRRRVMLECGP